MRPNWFIGLSFEEADWFVEKVHSPPSGIRLFHPEDLHLTVAFLGGVTREQAMEAWKQAEHWPTGIIPVTLGEVTGMGNPRRVSAYSALLDEGREVVVEGMALTRGAMWEAAGARVDTRPPKPHLTLARPSRKAGASLRNAGLEWAQTLALKGTTLALNEIALYTWSHDRKQRLFEKVARQSLL